MTKHATLEDVAREANVSTATVSRCLNNEKTVRESTRARVFEAIENLGYTPNFGARALAAKRTFIIGAIIPTMDNAIFASGIQAFQEELSQSGYTLLVSSSSYNRSLEEIQIRNLISRGADALLLIGEDRDPKIYDLLRRRNIPYVIAWSYHKSHEHIFVGFDNYNAAKCAAQEVIDLGHKNIGIIAGLTHDNDRARDRLRGFLDACTKNNIKINQSQIQEAPYNFHDAGIALDKILNSNSEISAVICGNDVLAVGSIIHAKKKGIRVSEDLGFIGFDDIEIASIISPSLTTIHVPHRKMGRAAAQKLIELLSTNHDVSSLELEPNLILRESLRQLES